MDLEESNALDAILAKIPDGPEETAPEPTVEHVEQETPTEAHETAPETASEEPSEGVQQEAQDEPAQPAIAPPPTWKADLKAEWGELPEHLQRSLAQWEEDRNRGVNGKLEEAAELRKAAEAEKQAVAQERQRYAQQLDQFIQHAQNLDPILAEAQKIDWAKLAQEDPASYVAKKAVVDQRLAVLNQAMQERQALAKAEQDRFSDAQKAHLEEQSRRASEKIPEWRDAAKRESFVKEVKGVLTDRYGFSPAELEGMSDHRFLVIAKDLVTLQKLQTAQKTVETKKAPPPVTRVVKPGTATSERPAQDARVKALFKQAKTSHSDKDAVSAILAAIGD